MSAHDMIRYWWARIRGRTFTIALAPTSRVGVEHAAAPITLPIAAQHGPANGLPPDATLGVATFVRYRVQRSKMPLTVQLAAEYRANVRADWSTISGEYRTRNLDGLLELVAIVPVPMPGHVVGAPAAVPVDEIGGSHGYA